MIVSGRSSNVVAKILHKAMDAVERERVESGEWVWSVEEVAGVVVKVEVESSRNEGVVVRSLCSLSAALCSVLTPHLFFFERAAETSCFPPLLLCLLLLQ